MRSEVKGALLVAASSFFWGISGTVAKFMFNDKVNPFKLVNMRLNLAFVMLFIFFSIFDREKLKIRKEDIKYLVIMGIIGIVGVQTTYYYTISALNVSIAIFLQYLAPILIVAYSVIFLKEKLSCTIALTLVISLAGSIFIIFGRGASASESLNTLGIIAGLASAVLLSFYTIFSKTCTRRLNAWTVLLYGLGFGALAFWFVSPPWELWRQVTLKELGYASYISVFATAIPFGLYLMGLQFLTPSSASIIAMLEPVIASISAFIILNETMTFIQILGGFMIIAASIIINIYNMKRGNPNNEQQIENNKEEYDVKSI